MHDFEETGRAKYLQQMAAEMEYQSQCERQEQASQMDGYRERVVARLGKSAAGTEDMPTIVTDLSVPPFQNLKERFEAEEARVLLSSRCSENWKYHPSAMRVVASLPGDQQVSHSTSISYQIIICSNCLGHPGLFVYWPSLPILFSSSAFDHGPISQSLQVQQICVSEDDKVLFGSSQGYLGLARPEEGGLIWGHQAHKATVGG